MRKNKGMSTGVSTGLIAVIVVVLIAGVGGGYFAGSSSRQGEIDSLTRSADDLTAEVEGLEGELEDAILAHTILEEAYIELADENIGLIHSLEEIGIASTQLEKDALFLEKLFILLEGDESNITIYDLVWWAEVQNASDDVDPLLRNQITDIQNAFIIFLDLAENPPEDASWEELALWEADVMIAFGEFNDCYLRFEATYINAIQRHIEDLTTLVPTPPLFYQ